MIYSILILNKPSKSVPALTWQPYTQVWLCQTAHSRKYKIICSNHGVIGAVIWIWDVNDIIISDIMSHNPNSFSPCLCVRHILDYFRLFRDRFERTRVKEYSEHGNRPNKEESRAKGEGQDRRASRGPQTQAGMEFNAFTPSIKIPFFPRLQLWSFPRRSLTVAFSHTFHPFLWICFVFRFRTFEIRVKTMIWWLFLTRIGTESRMIFPTRIGTQSRMIFPARIGTEAFIWDYIALWKAQFIAYERLVISSRYGKRSLLPMRGLCWVRAMESAVYCLWKACDEFALWKAHFIAYERLVIVRAMESAVYCLWKACD